MPRRRLLRLLIPPLLPVFLIAAAPTAQPDAASLARAEELVKEVFKEEYAAVKRDAAAGKALAATLLKQAGEIREKQDAAVRFVALREARDLAARAGDVATAFRAVAELEPDGGGTALDMQVEVLAAAGRSPDGRMQLAELALSLANACGDKEDFDRAVRFVRLAEERLDDTEAPELRAAVQRRGRELRALQRETARLRPFVARLKDAPEDPEANQQVGASWCFVRGQWSRGLPLLAKGASAGLRDLARKELDSPADGPAQAALADGWWQQAQNAEGGTRTQMLRRSYQWYRQAVFRTEGALKLHAEQRVVALEKLLPAALRVTDIAVEVRKLEGHTGEVLSAALAADGRLALSGSSDRTVRLWDVAEGKERRRLDGHTGPVYGVALAPDGSLGASCGEDRTVRLWDLSTGKQVRVLEGHTEFVNNVAFAPDGRHLVSAGQDRTLRLWEVGTGKEVRRFEGHTGGVYGVAFSPDGRRLLSGGIDQALRLWDVASGKEQRRFEGHAGQVLGVAWAPDGRRVLSAGEDRTIRLWDVEAGKEVRRFEGHTATVGGAVFSPDGLRLLSASDDRTLRLWEVETGKQLRQLQGHTDAVYRVSVSRDGRLALSCSLDRTLRVWGEPR